MSLYITNYLFTKKIIDTLDKKYKALIDNEKLFTYANFINILDLYNLSVIKKNDKYHLSKNIYESNKYFLISTMCSYIKQNNYSNENVLLLYAMICNISIRKHLEPCFISEKDKIKYDNYVYSLNKSFSSSKVKISKRFRNAFLFSYTDFDFINEFMSKVCLFKSSEGILKISLKKLRKLLKTSRFNKILISIFEIFKKDDDKYSNHINVLSKKIRKLKTYKTIDNKFSIINKEVNELIEMINDHVYYNKDLNENKVKKLL
ncbi:MAG: hypothetical protein ACRC5M_06115 [Anaeroplasmataceae bacterium]